MPEGDAVFLTAHRLNGALAGRPVTRFEIRVPALALADQRGSSVLEVRPYGKHILMRFSDNRTLHSHLRMDGSWRVGPTVTRGSAPAHAIRAIVGTDGATASGVNVHDLALVPTAEEHTLIGHLGPDLLADDLDVTQTATRLATAAEQPLGVALLDQRLLAGLGTIWRSEVLWLNRLSPFAPVSSVDDVEGLVRNAAKLLRSSVARRLGPRSRDPFRANEGQLEVYGRSARPCRRCGTPIAMSYQGPEKATERIVYFCPGCQKVS